MTPAERPHPFPSRTRKLSSPAPKILRGQPFGKIGRRRDFAFPGVTTHRCSSSGPARARSAMLDPMTDDGRVPEGPDAAASATAGIGDASGPPIHSICPFLLVRRRRVAERQRGPGASLHGGHAPGPARRREAASTLPDRRTRHLRDLPGRRRGARASGHRTTRPSPSRRAHDAPRPRSGAPRGRHPIDRRDAGHGPGSPHRAARPRLRPRPDRASSRPVAAAVGRRDPRRARPRPRPPPRKAPTRPQAPEATEAPEATDEATAGSEPDPGPDRGEADPGARRRDARRPTRSSRATR